MQAQTFDIGRLRDYSSLFSGQTCERVLRTNSVSAFQNMIATFVIKLRYGGI